MITTLIFLPSLLLIIPSLITIPTTKAVDFFTNCGGSLTYTQNSSYQTNLRNLLPTLSTQASTSGFYNTSLGPFPNRVYALYLCRPDVGSRGCNQCVYQAQTKILQQCPTQVWAVIWCDECMLRFSNTPLYRTMQVSPRAVSSNPANVTRSLALIFSKVVNDTMAGLVSRVGNDPARFGTEEANVTGSKLYALAQCTPDLSQGECDTCLRVAMGQLPIMQSGGRVMQPSCNMRFELDDNFYGDYFNYTFLLSATNSTTTPSSVSATNTTTTPTSVSATNTTTPPPTSEPTGQRDVGMLIHPN
ncbi:hypothetical protein Cgig2_011185 [Carnegiea gigantea]|uniref:Gnk2-homologous domain-containing protein n=1 Tax=Carnegiea gigantea TaxID=171969 RepID=A0A9Q1KGD3_9CARY|nr:hypothetical protein Cgig2_011185 [Carnegiea gigantea]